MAAAETVTTKCGAPIRSVVKTETGSFITSSTNFASVPGAAVSITIPAGESQCVKVRFSVQMRCVESAEADLCGIRVIVPFLTTFYPNINGVTFASEQGNAMSVRSFDWVARLDAGSHIVRLQAGVQNAATSFELHAWTMNVEIAK